ncbi:MAG TPA: hypothetical protein GXX70_00060 [Tepidimicrobium sp.]|nr:hypothetical protein [Tepidimicrobium sp.]
MKVKVSVNEFLAFRINQEDIEDMSDIEIERYIADRVVDEITNNGLINWTWEIAD